MLPRPVHQLRRMRSAWSWHGSETCRLWGKRISLNLPRRFLARIATFELREIARMANTKLFQEVRRAVRRWLSKPEWRTLPLERTLPGPFAFRRAGAASWGLR